MYLSKSFDCIFLHDLLMVKFAAHGFDQNVLIFICSYLNDQKKCVKKKRLNGFFFFPYIASLHNFADKNTLSLNQCMGLQNS